MYSQGGSSSFVLSASLECNRISTSHRTSRNQNSPRYPSSPALTPPALGGASFVEPDDNQHLSAERTFSPQGRGSRYIPQRDENTSARFDLASQAKSSTPPPHSSTSLHPAAASNNENSFISRLAAHAVGDAGSILRFGRAPLSVTDRAPRRAAYLSCNLRASSTPHTRSSAAVRILDAPKIKDFPQTLDWGKNNRLIVALGQQLYVWCAVTNDASELTLLESSIIRCVRWMEVPSSPSFIVVAYNGGLGTMIIDGNTGAAVTRLKMPIGPAIDRSFGSSRDVSFDETRPPIVTSVAVSGPIVATSTDHESYNVAMFDIRQRRSLLRSFEAHSGGASCVTFLPREPFYLASGGIDGTIQIWDVRMSSDDPRYSFRAERDDVITSLHWATHKRSLLFAGTARGDICLIDTHIRASHAVTHRVATGNSVSSLAVSQQTGEVISAHGVGSDPRGGHLQIRRSMDLVQQGTLQGLQTTEPMASITMSPDCLTVAAAQMDETIKFWDASARPLKSLLSSSPTSESVHQIFDDPLR